MVSYTEHWDFWINGGSNDSVYYAVKFVAPGWTFEKSRSEYLKNKTFFH